MKTCPRCHQNKKHCEFRSDSRYRDKLGSWCIACHKERGASWAAEHRDHLSAKAAKWRKANPDKSRAADRSWKLANKAKLSDSYRRWRLSNLDYDCARVALRSAKRRRAVPIWADVPAIMMIYRHRPRGYDVDHIVPLKSNLVCGLHWEGNLQYLPSAHNQAKRNFHWPDMP
jgi:hypothetical protein